MISDIPSQFSAQQFGVYIIEIGPQGKMLLQKYQGVPILLNTLRVICYILCNCNYITLYQEYL